MEEELKANIRAVFDAYSARQKLAASTVFLRAARNARFLEDITAGKGFTVRSYDNVMRWFSTNWPDGAEWPAHVARPSCCESGAAA
jgi:hypothetical protein